MQLFLIVMAKWYCSWHIALSHKIPLPATSVFPVRGEGKQLRQHHPAPWSQWVLFLSW